jgi:hypothetical protein
MRRLTAYEASDRNDRSISVRVMTYLVSVQWSRVASACDVAAILKGGVMVHDAKNDSRR